jgi:RHS repeat-associated protein
MATDYTPTDTGTKSRGLTGLYIAGKTRLHPWGPGGGGINYVQSAQYAPFGGLTSMTQGATPITTTDAYNKRLQPVTLSAATGAATILSLSYDFHLAAGDNGDVFQIVNNRDNNRTQNFTYDGSNRISQANTTGPNWGETFTIDPWANLTNRGPVAGKTNYELLNASPASVLNQLPGYGYDAAGNLTSNGSAAYTYDAENRLLTTAGVTYTYDGDGKRVKKSNGTLYWTGTGSDPLTESDLSGTIQKEYIFFAGKRVARRDVPGTPSVKYYFSDHLGSASVITNASGAMPPLEESDYYPYGGEIVVTNGDPNQYKFTGKERDTESGLDYFGARFNASTIGRFMTPDGGADQDTREPQSWNLYSYVHNNPLNRTDADGRTVSICDSNGENCKAVSDKDYAQAQQQDQYNHAASLDQLKKNDGGLSNITDSNGNVVGTVMYTHDENAPAEGITPGLLGPGDLVLLSQLKMPSFVGEVVGKVLGSILGKGAEEAGAGVEEILAKASSSVGNQGIKAASKDAAEQAAKEWVGEGAQPIVERSTGEQVGWKSADGTKTARFTSANKPEPHINLENKMTKGNLHVQF